MCPVELFNICQERSQNLKQAPLNLMKAFDVDERHADIPANADKQEN